MSTKCHFVFVALLSFCIALMCNSELSFSQLQQPATLQNHFKRSSRNIPNPKVHRCGEVGRDLVVNFVNTNYPNDDTTAGDCKFRMMVTSQHTCQIRVDFVDTELMDPVRGECLSQFFIVQGAIWPTGLPPLCGINNDQHFYLHLEPWYTNVSVVDFNLVTVVRGRPYRFGVWLTQIDCSSFNVLKGDLALNMFGNDDTVMFTNNAPEGCTQYFLAENGAIKSFNYEGYRYLNAQNYQICIRPVRGPCGIRYDSAPGEFAVKKSIVANKEVMQRSGIGSAICGWDYILIPEGRAMISSVRRERLLFNRRRRPAAAPAPQPVRKRPEVTTSVDRFCGAAFSPIGGDKTSKPIYARVRSNLIFMQVRTTPLQEERGSIEALNLTTGFRITYRQIKDCGNTEADMVIPESVNTLLDTFTGDFAGRKPNGSSEEIQATSASSVVNKTATEQESTENLPENDEIWDYLDDHSEDNDEDEKDLYNF